MQTERGLQAKTPNKPKLPAQMTTSPFNWAKNQESSEKQWRTRAANACGKHVKISTPAQTTEKTTEKAIETGAMV